MERSHFLNLQILEESDAIIRDCRILAKLDVLSSFGFLALQQAYVRPLLNYRCFPLCILKAGSRVLQNKSFI